MNATVAELLDVSIRLFERYGERYALIGAIACGVWGRPRYTSDVDAVVSVSGRTLRKLLREAGGLAFEFDEAAANMSLGVSGVIRLNYRGRHLDLIAGDTDFDKSALRRARAVRIGKRHVSCATAEDVIVYKLVAGREQDIADVIRIIERQSHRFDAGYLRKWTQTVADKLKRPDIPERLAGLLLKNVGEECHFSALASRRPDSKAR